MQFSFYEVGSDYNYSLIFLVTDPSPNLSLCHVQEKPHRLYPHPPYRVAIRYRLRVRVRRRV